MLEGGGSTDPSKRPNDPFVLYSIPAFDAGEPEFSLGRDIGSPKKRVVSGDVLLSRIVPHIRRSWIVGDHADSEILASGEWIVFRSQKVHAPYLRHFLISDVFHPQFMKTVVGVGGSLLRAKPDYVAEIGIPLPPLEEQRRIAEVLDKSDVLRRKRKRALELCSDLVMSIFVDIFGDPIKNTQSNPVVQVGDVTTCIVPGRDKPRSFTGTIPWVTTRELVPLGYTRSECAKLHLSEAEVAAAGARVIPAKSVVMTCVGDLGVTSIAADPMVINQQLHSFQCSDRIVPEYLMHALGYHREYMFRRATQTTVPYMNKTVCNSIPIQLPPIELQERFSDRFRQIWMNVKRASLSEQRFTELFSSLQHRAFSGQL